MKKSILIICFATLLYSCTKQETITEPEVISAIKKFDVGWEKKNMAAVDSVLSPSYIYFTQSGNTFTRDSVVATAGESSYTLTNMNRTEMAVTITGNTAVVSTRWQGVGTYRGVPFNEDQRCSIVLIKEQGVVQILTEHCTPIRGPRIFH